MSLDERFDNPEHLPVEVMPPTAAGSLEPNLSSGDLMLEGALEEGQQFPFGANVASLLIFDLDSTRTIATVEVLMPPSRWKVVDALPPELLPQRSGRRASLRVPSTKQEVYVEDLSPEFLLERASDLLLIQIEDPAPGGRWVALSDLCKARVDGDRLAALTVQL